MVQSAAVLEELLAVAKPATVSPPVAQLTSESRHSGEMVLMRMSVRCAGKPENVVATWQYLIATLTWKMQK